MFELKDRDAAGRIGVLEIGKKTIETPAIFTVINPRKLVIPPKELAKDFKLNLLITNSYLIWKNQQLKEATLQKGLHTVLDFDGLIMTDSGAYQLQEYGGVEVNNRQIIEFQQKIGSDLGVILDVPQAGNFEEVQSALETTMQRAKEWANLKPTGGWVGPIQGAEHTDLVAKSAQFMGKLPFDVYALGSCVPYLLKYDFKTVVEGIVTARKNLPPNKPLHAFGAGLPMFFSIATAAGADLFDSASYALYAEDDRYMTVEGTRRLGELEYFPCCCPICSKTTPQELRGLPKEERVGQLSRHNLWAIVNEIAAVKQAIKEGRLFELAEQRARAHPRLLDAVRQLYNHSDWLETQDPVTKHSAFFYTGPESLKRPAGIRHQKKLMERYRPAGKLTLLKSTPLGIVPSELEDLYPLGQQEYPRMSTFRGTLWDFVGNSKYKVAQLTGPGWTN